MARSTIRCQYNIAGLDVQVHIYLRSPMSKINIALESYTSCVEYTCSLQNEQFENPMESDPVLLK